YLFARRDPDVSGLETVLDHLAQRRRAPGLPEQTRVRADREHRGVSGTRLAADLVEAALHHLDEVRGSGEALREDEAGVVVGERVRDDEVLLPRHLHEVRE